MSVNEICGACCSVINAGLRPEALLPCSHVSPAAASKASHPPYQWPSVTQAGSCLHQSFTLQHEPTPSEQWTVLASAASLYRCAETSSYYTAATVGPWPPGAGAVIPDRRPNSVSCATNSSPDSSSVAP